MENALAAISLSALLGVPLEYVKSGLAKAKSPGRMEVFYSKDGKEIIVLEAWVYAAKYDKRQYLRQVESLLYSFEWDKDDAVEK